MFVQLRHYIQFSLLFIFCILLVEQVFPERAEKKFTISSIPSYAALLTNNLDTKIPIENFSCTERIYIYFTWYLLEGQYKVNVLWINPQGKEENQAQLKFATKKPKINNWVALEFKDIFNQINPITPNFKATKLIGKWNARILLEGKLLETMEFNIDCG